MLACGVREAVVMPPPPTRDSAESPCLHGCPAFLHWHFPPQSPPSHPLNPSLHSEQQSSPWDCSTIPKLQLQATAPSRGPVFLPRVCMASARTVWFSLHLGCHRSAVSLSALNASRQLPRCGDQTPVSVPPPAEGMSSPTNTPVFPPSSSSYCFCVVLYILFHWSGPPVCSQLVFCMHVCVWRCIPDVSVERDGLHVRLLLHHLVLQPLIPF